MFSSFSLEVLLEASTWQINLPATDMDAEQSCSDTTFIDNKLRDRGQRICRARRILPETVDKGIFSALQFHQTGKLTCILCPQHEFKKMKDSLFGSNKGKSHN